jgi:hypothetical protein
MAWVNPPWSRRALAVTVLSSTWLTVACTSEKNGVAVRVDASDFLAYNTGRAFSHTYRFASLFRVTTQVVSPSNEVVKAA